MKSPFQLRPHSSKKTPVSSDSSALGLALISFFSNYISPADGPRSPSYPTGSAYGKMAVQKYGFFMGSILTADRLIHESDVPLGPIIILYQKRRFYDPLESNTFWWDSPKTDK